jgi:hypothetical protein
MAALLFSFAIRYSMIWPALCRPASSQDNDGIFFFLHRPCGGCIFYTGFQYILGIGLSTLQTALIARLSCHPSLSTSSMLITVLGFSEYFFRQLISNICESSFQTNPLKQSSKNFNRFDVSGFLVCLMWPEAIKAARFFDVDFGIGMKNPTDRLIGPSIGLGGNCWAASAMNLPSSVSWQL